MAEDSIRLRHRPELVAYLDSFVVAESRAVLPPWLASSWLFRVPPAVEKADTRLYIIRLMMLLIACSVHFGLAVLFAAFAYWGLALVNVGSVIWYVASISLLRAGRHDAGIFLGILEAYVHGFVFTLVLGLQSGYVFYSFGFLVVALLAFRPRERRKRAIAVALAILSAPVGIVLSHVYPPLLILDPMKLEILSYVNVTGSLMVGIGAVFYFWSAANHAQHELERALAGSENLLLNVLPRPIAERLKHQPGTIADSVESASVLFADIVGFTPLAATMPNAAVVQMLGELFSAFDRFAERLGIEKIKTIGDAYLAVSGLPEPREDHVAAICEMALAMQTYVKEHAVRNGVALSMRIGIHTGPVVAGVIGQRKFTYDIWGDTVNTASRMESHGLPGFIQVTEAVVQRVGGRFECQERGTVTIKGKGEMRTWFLKERARASATPETQDTAPAKET